MSEPSLTEFLLARIAEDAANIDGDWAGGDGGLHIISTPMHDRMVAECEAKRGIVRECRGMDEQGPSAAVLADLVLEALALPYADHPDYREEWRP